MLTIRLEIQQIFRKKTHYFWCYFVDFFAHQGEIPNKDQNFKCINCIRNNKPISDHSTNWRKCPFYITAIINQTESTEYAIK